MRRKGKKILFLLMAVVLTVMLGACGNATKGNEDSKQVESTNQKKHNVKINWARQNSGNAMLTVARQKGYLAEYGIEVVDKPIQTVSDASIALENNQIDVYSNYGSTMPLQTIAKGSDAEIVGGYMLQGISIITQKGNKWNGIQDLVGSTMGNDAGSIPILSALLEAGYDPMKDVTYKPYNTNADRMAAVAAGEVDYAVMSGFQLYPVSQNPNVEIAVYFDELMPAYGCCRMVMRSSFVKENPELVKDLLKALIRAEQFYKAHPEEVVPMLVEELKTSPEYVEAFLLNEHYKLSADPGKKALKRTWDVMLEIGLLEKEYDKPELIEERINVDLYKKALDECVKEHYDEDPEFYDERIKFYKENNENISF